MITTTQNLQIEKLLIERILISAERIIINGVLREIFRANVHYFDNNGKTLRFDNFWEKFFFIEK